jgi:acyl-CoA thioester hydrolase
MTEMNRPKALHGYPVILTQRLSWGDMDAYGHVNNTRYFRYFEDSRIHYWETIQERAHFRLPSGLGLVVASASCKYRLPLVYPDNIDIACRVERLDESRFTMTYRVYSRKLEKVAAEGDSLLVCFDLKNQTRSFLPPEIADWVRKIEAEADHELQ